LEKDGDGGMLVTGANDLSGEVSILAGSLQIQQIVSGPAIVNTATFTNTTLTVAFSSTPSSGQQFRLLAGSTFQTYTPTLTGAGAATATYNSTNSTLTIT
jgi:autotransporter-associated beta strand protein